MHKKSFNSNKSLKEIFSSARSDLPDGEIPLSMLVELFGTKSYLVLAAFFTLPFLIPVSIPGFSTVFGFFVLLIGISQILNQPPSRWLSERLQTKTLPADKIRAFLSHGLIWIHRLEKISRSRASLLCRGSVIRVANGLAITVAAIFLMAPLAFIPFSNTLPALSILLLSIGLLQQDGILVALAYFFLFATALYFSTIILLGANAVFMLADMALRLLR